MVSRAFCPKCGDFSYGYEPADKIYHCFSVKCGFVDKDNKYGQGLSQNPFVQRDSSGLVKKIVIPSESEKMALVIPA